MLSAELEQFHGPEWTDPNSYPIVSLAVQATADREAGLDIFAKSKNFPYIAKACYIDPSNTHGIEQERNLFVNDPDRLRRYAGSQIEDAYREHELFEKNRRYPLTELLTREAMTHDLAAALGYAKRMNQRICALFIDIDRFKRYNEKRGHPAGDMLLIDIGRIMGSRMRKGSGVRLANAMADVKRSEPVHDTAAAHFGGDEYAAYFVLPPIDPNVPFLADHVDTAVTRDRPGLFNIPTARIAAGIAGRITTPINDHLAGRGVKGLGASAGVATYDPAIDGLEMTAEELMRRADVDLQRAKKESHLRTFREMSVFRRWCILSARVLLKAADVYDPRLH